MQHTNYFSFQADTNYDLGFQLGAQFKNAIQAKMSLIIRDEAWKLKERRSKKYFEITNAYFPQYIQEVKGYSKGAEVDFMDFWIMSLEDEFSFYQEEHCTSIITNDGKLISHNEDWAKGAADEICVLQKTIGELTILELNYFNTLGGNSASINSYGYTHLINTLTHSDWQLGVPRNVIARFMSETKNPKQDFKRLQSIKRATGYNHNFVNLDGHIWNIESTSKDQVLIEPNSPFVHTNHYLSKELKPLEAETAPSTFKRFEIASERLRPHISETGLIELASDTSQGTDLSIFNERTIARMIVNIEHMVAKIWLLREEDKGWVEYPLNFAKKTNEH